MNEKYNGWTNYATWRVNLEVFDDDSCYEFFDLTQDAYDLGQDLKSHVEDHIEETSEGLAQAYALAFLSEVNWYEIATSMKKAHQEEVEQ